MGEFRVRIIIEILGRPKENVTTALNALIQRLSTEKGVSIVEKIVHDPVEVKESKDLFTTFAEITLDVNSIEVLVGIVFAYMPSNVELIYPESINITNSNLSELANRIVQRLHTYDAITKKVLHERDILLNKLKEIKPELFKQIQKAPIQDQNQTQIRPKEKSKEKLKVKSNKKPKSKKKKAKK